MNAKLPCPEPNALERLLLGDMPAEEMEALERHVGVCRRCLAVLQDANPRIRWSMRCGPPEKLEPPYGRGRFGPDRPHVSAAHRRGFAGCALAGHSSRPVPAWAKSEELSSLLGAPEEPDELGRFGTYGLLRCLGSGGMGVVFAARQVCPAGSSP